MLLRLALAALLAWSFTAFTLDRWGATRDPEGVYDAIIVAGCRVYPDGSPSPALAWRVGRAVQLWKAGHAPVILFTGGLGEYPPTEATAAATLARTLGVPANAVKLEDQSTSTEENARLGAERHPAYRRVLVVTDAYHVFRARRVFDRYFETVDAVASPYGAWSRVRGAYREVLAVAGYGVAGRL